MQQHLKDVTRQHLGKWLASQKQPAFRAGQIIKWLYKSWVTSAQQMTNLPAGLRAALAEQFTVFAPVCRETLKAPDGTRKFLLELADGETIETVLLRTPKRTTVCISTQVGCPVRCSFCASGRGGGA